MLSIAIQRVFMYVIRAGPHNKGSPMPESLIDSPEPMEWVAAIERLIDILPWAPYLVVGTAVALFIRYALCPLIRAWRQK